MFKNNHKRPSWSPQKSPRNSYQSGRTFKKPRYGEQNTQEKYWVDRKPERNRDHSETEGVHNSIRRKPERNRDHSETEGAHNSIRRNPEVYTDECESYFKNSLETLKTGIDEDQKAMFIENVLEQTEGKELQLSCQSVNSQCIEFLLTESNNRNVIIRFLKSFATNKEDAFGNRFASHVTETILYLSLCHLQNWYADIEPKKESDEAIAKANELREMMMLIHEFGEFGFEHLETCLEDEYGCKVLRTLIQVFGGCYVGSNNNLNSGKQAKNQKKRFEKNYLGSSFILKEKESIVLNEVPKLFIDILKSLAKAFLKLDSLKTHSAEARTSPVLQSILFVFKKRLPKRFKKVVEAIVEALLEEKNSNGISTCLTHKSSSFVVEKLFEVVHVDQQQQLWTSYFSEHLELLVINPVGNYVIQRLFDVVEDKTMFEVMCTAIFDLFSTIFRARHFGILVSIASACNRLECQQAQFMKAVMTSLCCLEPQDRQLQVIPLLLGFQKYEDYMRDSNSDEKEMLVTLQGSLLSQSILKFLKPIKCVSSMLHMKSEDINYLACHIQGCHVLTAYFESSYVGEKNKDKFLDLLKPVIKSLATDRNGGLTLSRIWVLLTMKQRSSIAQEFVKNEREIGDSPNGATMMKKFGIFQFKKRNEEWRKFQETLGKKPCK